MTTNNIVKYISITYKGIEDLLPLKHDGKNNL